jgi:NADH-quinone oxidoreductase subunit M
MLISLLGFCLFSTILLVFVDLKHVRMYSFNATLLLFLYSLTLLFYFEVDVTSYQYQFYITWGDFFNIYYSIGLDGLSLFFVLLTTFLMPFCLLLSWVNVSYRLREFAVCMLIIEFFLINVFTVLDFFFFYIFFECILIPMFLLIGIWGSRQRKIHASYQFFLYTLLGSLLMLLAIVYIYVTVGTTDLSVVLLYKFEYNVQLILWLCFFLSFAVKIPMVPVHIWLPEAHVEAPTSGSVLLAGLLLKMGGYAILRFLIPVFNYASVYFMPFVFCLSVISILYSSLTTIRQLDLKKIIAYSSVAHMNYVTIGVFSYELYGIEGAIYLMLSHGLVSSALFICVGIVYDRYKSRILKYYGGLVQLMPLYAFFFFLFSLANMSFPGTSSFIGELLVLISAFSVNTLLAFYAGFGMVLNGVYVIWLYNRLFFGILDANRIKFYSDLNKREFYILLPLAVLVLFFGIKPNSILNIMEYSILGFLNDVQILYY